MLISRRLTRSFLLAAWLTAGAASPATGAEERPRPNFLFLFADDQTFRALGALGDPQFPVQTPQLDRLAARGLLFTHCFNQGSWSGAVCICSRAMLHTGQFLYHSQTGIDRPEIPLWGETLGRAGYRTLAIGKWHNGDASAMRGFQDGRAMGAGMYAAEGGMYGRPAAGNSWTPWDRSLGGHWRPRVWDFSAGKAGPKYAAEEHSSELYAGRAARFLREEAGRDGRPFFLYVSFNAPHDPRQAPREFVDRYPPGALPLPPNYLPEHPFDQGDHTLRDEQLAPFPRTEEAARLHLSEYCAIITHLDAQIGRVLQALDESGLADNTVVFFTADHGLAVGQHGLMGKQSQYDHSIRVPFVVAGPGIPAGQRNEALVYLQSSYATTCELAGAPLPPSVEFPSLLPVIRGERRELHDAIYGSYRGFQRMIRTSRHKLILYPHLGKRQLFDLESDPWETKDLAAEPESAPRVAALTARLVQLQRDVGDTLDLGPLAVPPPPDGGVSAPEGSDPP